MYIFGYDQNQAMHSFFITTKRLIRTNALAFVCRKRHKITNKATKKGVSVDQFLQMKHGNKAAMAGKYPFTKKLDG